MSEFTGKVMTGDYPVEGREGERGRETDRERERERERKEPCRLVRATMVVAIGRNRIDAETAFSSLATSLFYASSTRNLPEQSTRFNDSIEKIWHDQL